MTRSPGGRSTDRSAPDGGAPARLLRAALWIAVLVAVIVALGRLGSGRLSTPPLLDRSELQVWLDDRDAATATFALVRLVGLAFAWYLLAVTVLGLAARLSRIPSLVRMADLATLPTVRRALGALAGVGLTASAASLVAADLLPQPAPGGGGSAALVDDEVVLARLPPGDDDVSLQRLPAVGDGTSTLEVEEERAAEHRGTWTVVPGDHLWHIAEGTLAGSWGRAPSDDEVVSYWSDLVAANRDVVADPDLVHPGQTIRLPTPPPPGPAPG